MIMEPGPVVFHTNLYKRLTVSDGGVLSFSAQFNVGGLMRLTESLQLLDRPNENVLGITHSCCPLGLSRS